MKKDLMIYALFLFLCIICFVGGRMTKEDKKCPPCLEKVKYIEKRIEIKSIENEIKNIDISRERKHRDILRSKLNPA